MTTLRATNTRLPELEATYQLAPNADLLTGALVNAQKQILSSNAHASHGHISVPTPPQVTAKSLEEQLFDALAVCKIDTRQFAMLFDKEWHTKLFRQLDILMDAEEWDSQDEPVTRESFRTLLRLLMIYRDKRRPGLGIANHGNIIATWASGPRDRINIECMPNDKVRWLLTRPLDEDVETAAGLTRLSELKRCLSPYDPEHWFNADT